MANKRPKYEEFMFRQYLQLVWLRGFGALKADAQKSYLGTLWWVLEPILLTALFYTAFTTGIRGGGKDIAFIAFLITGLLPLKWTQSSISGGANSLLNNRGFIGQVYVPKWIFPVTVNLSMLIRFVMTLPILVGVSVYMNGYLNIDSTSLITVMFVQTILGLGVSMWIASSVPVIPDLAHLIPMIMTALLFTSGVFYDINTKPEEIQSILRLNPLTEILEAYRHILLNQGSLTILNMKYSATFAAVTLALGIAQISMLNRYYPRLIP